MTVDWGQVVQAVAIGVPSFYLGYLALRRSQKNDAIAAQSGLAAGAREGTGQIIDGLNRLIDNLQEDNENFRAEIRLLTTRLDAVSKERDDLKLELARMRRKYGNGDP